MRGLQTFSNPALRHLLGPPGQGFRRGLPQPDSLRRRPDCENERRRCLLLGCSRRRSPSRSMAVATAQALSRRGQTPRATRRPRLRRDRVAARGTVRVIALPARLAHWHDRDRLLEARGALLASDGCPSRHDNAGRYHDDAERTPWSDTLERIANPPELSSYVPVLQMSCYPSPLLLYGRGIAAMAGKRHRTLGNLLYRTRTRDLTNEYPLALGFGARDPYEAGTWMNNHVQLTGHPGEGLGTTIRRTRTCTSRLGSRCALSGRLWCRRTGSRTMMRYNLANC